MKWQTILMVGTLVFSESGQSASLKILTTSMSKPFHQITNTLNYTSDIGTTDHPTIEGGMINTTENISLSYDNKQTLLQTEKLNLSSLNKNNQTAFKDDWATNKKVMHFLAAATSNGKLDYVLKKIDRLGLPASIAVVPMVESNYDTHAISTKGAAGAWQLMPATANDYGIKSQDRFQFAKATNAALNILNDLHRQFGNWELAFAAYNAGSKRITDALHKNPSAIKIDELDLSQETKIYVQRIKSVNKKLMELSIDI